MRKPLLYTDLDNTSSNLVRNSERQKLSPVSSSSNGNDLAQRKFSYEEEVGDEEEDKDTGNNTGNNSDSPLANRKNVDKKLKSHSDVRDETNNFLQSKNHGKSSRQCHDDH